MRYSAKPGHRAPAAIHAYRGRVAELGSLGRFTRHALQTPFTTRDDEPYHCRPSVRGYHLLGFFPALDVGAQFTSELKQPENPAQSAAQNFERTIETELPLPVGTKVQETITMRDERKPDAPPVVTEKTIVLSEPTIQKTRTVEKAGTTIGAAQKDTAREFGAKLSSLKGIVWVGVAMFLFGLATLAYPPLRAIIGSVTTSLAIVAGGVALMILPTLVVGNELLILGGVAVAVGGWFLAHRHGQLKGFVDANKNGVDDRIEAGKRS